MTTLEKHHRQVKNQAVLRIGRHVFSSLTPPRVPSWQVFTSHLGHFKKQFCAAYD